MNSQSTLSLLPVTGHMVDFLQMLVDGSRAKTEGIREGASLGQQKDTFSTRQETRKSSSLVSMVDRLFKGFHNIWDQKTNQNNPLKYEKMKRKNNK